MKIYGLNVRGSFILEPRSLPTFSGSDAGRVVFSNGEIYFNDSADYINVAGTNKDNAFTGTNNFSGELQVDSQNLSPVSNFKNKLINGNFEIWQRQTSQTSSSYGSDDRWFNQNSGSTKTHSRQSFSEGQTDVLGNPTYYSRTVVSSSAGAANFVNKIQKIENARTLSDGTATLSFYAKADSSKDIAVEFYQYFGTGGSPTGNSFSVTTFSLTSSWQKFTTTISVPSLSGVSLGTVGTHFLQMSFWFDAGSDWNFATNSLGQQSGTFDIAQVQLEEGSNATTFEQRSPQAELSLCQRYYEKSYALEIFPGATATNGSFYGVRTNGSGGTSVAFKVSKRTTPSVVSYSPDTGTSGKVRDTNLGSDQNASISDIGLGSCLLGSSAIAVGGGYRAQWTADAEL